MFKDYYLILEIPFEASVEEIKVAFKKQALRWHPDRNQGRDTKSIMQDINEAYLVLKDAEARVRYDNEYKRFKAYQKKESEFTVASNVEDDFPKESKYEFDDEILKRWMTNAREQASNLVSQTFKEIKIGAKAAGREMFQQFIAFAIIGLIFTIIFKACN